MAALFLSSAILFYLYLVFGLFFSKLFKFDCHIVDKLLLGLIVTNTISSFLSLFLPVNFYTLLFVLILSLVPLFLIKGELINLKKTILSNKDIIMMSVPLVVYAFLIALGPPKHYDTGLYHLQIIKWIETFPAVPGLANLHARFGYNSNIFTAYALTGLNEVTGQEIFAINFTLFSLFAIYFISRLKEIFIKQGMNNYFIFNLIILISVINFSRFISSPAPDYIAVTFVLYILARLLDYSGKENTVLYALFIISVYTVTVKLSALPLFLVFPLIFIKDRIPVKKLLLLSLLSSMVIIPWIIRYIILTGWFLYPFTSIDLFNFDWKMPASIVELEKLCITGWARIPGEQWSIASHMSFSEWFPIWWGRVSQSDRVQLIASFFFPILTLSGVVMKRIRLKYVQIAAIFVLIICLFYWLLIAPDFRFGRSFLLIASICPLIYLHFNGKISLIPFIKAKYFFSFLTFSLLMIFILKNAGDGYLSHCFRRIIIPEKIEVPDGYRYITHEINGLILYSPDGDSDQCFDHCIPCIPYPDKNVVLRKTNLSSGFRYINNP